MTVTQDIPSSPAVVEPPVLEPPVLEPPVVEPVETTPYPDADLIFVTDLLSDDEQERLAAARAFFRSEVRPLSLIHI